jgi:hypothetical protein
MMSFERRRAAVLDEEKTFAEEKKLEDTNSTGRIRADEASALEK